MRIGEATEVALRVLVEKIGPRGYGPMPTALEHMTKQERVLHCNHLWEAEFHKVGFWPSAPCCSRGAFLALLVLPGLWNPFANSLERLCKAGDKMIMG